jgi:DNA-binding MarR family transcriptional regulator
MSKSKFYNSDLIHKAYTGKKSLDFSYLVLAQVETVYRNKGMVFPVVTSSTLLYLSEQGSASLTEIAKALQFPHQVIAQRINSLSKLDLLEKHPDPNDKRRSEYHLTRKGKDQAARLAAYNIEAAAVFQSVFDDAGVDIGAALDSGCAALEEKTMAERFIEIFGTQK